jgi:hypothetical protein
MAATDERHKNYELPCSAGEAFFCTAMTGLIARRLAQT